MMFFLISPFTLYQLFYVGFSVLGIFYPVAYTYHLLDFIARYGGHGGT